MAELRDALKQLVKSALDRGADQAEAFGQVTDSREVWLENNKIKTIKSAPSHGLGIRVIKDKSLGFASANTLDEVRLEELCDQALALAKANLRDKFQLIPEPAKITPLKGLCDKKLTDLPLKEVINQTRLLLASARGYDKRVTIDSGGVFVNFGEKAIYNSHGLDEHESGTDISAMVIGMARDKKEVSPFDFQFDGSLKLSGIKIEAMARKFAENVVRSLGAKPAHSFTGAVLFSPHAVAETLLYPIISSINASNVQKGMSSLAGKLGKKIASTRLTITDDGLLAGGLSSSAFDREGMPHKKLTIIGKGKLKSYLYNAYTANREDLTTTGHASGGYRSIPRIGTTNLIITPGEGSKAQLVKDIKEGILVTRFSGNTNAITGDFSGTVKGGFYIKNGRILHPLTNTMIAGNVFDILTRITGLSKKLTRVFSYHLPYIAVDKVSITSG